MTMINMAKKIASLKRITAWPLVTTLALIISAILCLLVPVKQSYASGSISNLNWGNSSGNVYSGRSNTSPKNGFSFISSTINSFKYGASSVPIYYDSDDNAKCNNHNDVTIDIIPGNFISNHNASVVLSGGAGRGRGHFHGGQTNEVISNYRIPKEKFNYDSKFDACVRYITVSVSGLGDRGVFAYNVHADNAYVGIGGSSQRKIGLASPDYCNYAKKERKGTCRSSNSSNHIHSLDNSVRDSYHWCSRGSETIKFRVPCDNDYDANSNNYDLVIWDVDNHRNATPQRQNPLCGAAFSNNMLVKIKVKEDTGNGHPKTYEYVSKSGGHATGIADDLEEGGNDGRNLTNGLHIGRVNANAGAQNGQRIKKWKAGAVYTVTLENLWYGNLIAYRLPFSITANDECKTSWKTNGITYMKANGHNYNSTQNYTKNNPLEIPYNKASTVKWHHVVSTSHNTGDRKFNGWSKSSGSARYNKTINYRNFTLSRSGGRYEYNANDAGEKLPNNPKPNKVYCRHFTWHDYDSNKKDNKKSTKEVCVKLVQNTGDVRTKTTVRNVTTGEQSSDTVHAYPGQQVIWRHTFTSANGEGANNMLVDSRYTQEFNYPELIGGETNRTLHGSHCGNQTVLTDRGIGSNGIPVKGKNLISTSLKVECSENYRFTQSSGSCYYDTGAGYPWDQWPFGASSLVSNTDVGRIYCHSSLVSTKDNEQASQLSVDSAGNQFTEYTCSPKTGSWTNSNTACVEIPYDYNDGNPNSPGSGCREDCQYTNSSSSGVTIRTELVGQETIEANASPISFRYVITNQSGSHTKTLPINYRKYIFIIKGGKIDAADIGKSHAYYDEGDDTDPTVECNQRLSNATNCIESNENGIAPLEPGQSVDNIQWGANDDIKENISTGDQVCSYIAVDHRWSVHDNDISNYKLASNVVCYRVIRRPTMSIVGGDSYANGGFTAQASNGFRGSYAQYATIAGDGWVSNFGATGYLSNNALYNKLIFANKNGLGHSGVNINLFGGLTPYISQVRCGFANPVNKDLYGSGDVVLGCNDANQDVYITTNIGEDDHRSPRNNLNDIPNVRIYSARDIYINGSVSEIHANLIARGRVITCAEGSDNGNNLGVNKANGDDDDSDGSCNHQLNIYGSITSNGSPKFLRVYGAGVEDDLGDPQNEHSTTANGERIIYTPNLWMVPNYANQDRAIVDFNIRNVETLPNRF